MIRTKEYCDICEIELGEASLKAEITKMSGRPAFPQIIWTYYKRGLSIFKKTDGSEEPLKQVQWLGQPNRMEFCQHHALEVNTLLKSYVQRDSSLLKILEDLLIIDNQQWEMRESRKLKEFDQLHSEWSKKENNK